MSATCPCGWSQDYATTDGARRGLARHQARGCGPIRRGGCTPEVAEQIRARADQRWRDRLETAGLRGTRTTVEWLAHPTALDDLLRVMGGLSVAALDKERRFEREARAA